MTGRIQIDNAGKYYYYYYIFTLRMNNHNNNIINYYCYYCYYYLYPLLLEVCISYLYIFGIIDYYYLYILFLGHSWCIDSNNPQKLCYIAPQDLNNAQNGDMATSNYFLFLIIINNNNHY